MKELLNNFDLTDIDFDFGSDFFGSIIRVDDLIFASKVDSVRQVDFLSEKSVNLVIDLKNPGETKFDDRQEFLKAGIKYINFPISNIEDISFEKLLELKNEIDNSRGYKLIYCMSGNRVGALMTLILSEVLGHPKKRSFEFGHKVGMTKEALQENVKRRIKLVD